MYVGISTRVLNIIQKELNVKSIKLAISRVERQSIIFLILTKAVVEIAGL